MKPSEPPLRCHHCGAIGDIHQTMRVMRLPTGHFVFRCWVCGKIIDNPKPPEPPAGPAPENP